MSDVLTEPIRVRLPETPRKLMKRIVISVLIALAALGGVFSGMLVVYSVDLPEVSQLETYHPATTTELYDIQGRVIGSFALQRRSVVEYKDLPGVLHDAILSIEDKDFERHVGVDFWRVIGAAIRDARSGTRAQGASTLTMQLSRNLFLTPDRNFRRKIQEIMLAIQIERRFTKPQIFTMYCNQIFLGHGVYGFEAGAQYYFSKHAKDLTLPEAALLAGLPKGPSIYSPISNPERSLRRRNLVLNAMMEDGRITAEQAALAKGSPIQLNVSPAPNSLAPYFVEEIRRYLEHKYGTDEVHEHGLKVYTSLNMELQAAANQAVLDGLAAWEHRHGWRGRLPNVLAQGEQLESYTNPDWNQAIGPNTYLHALVTQVSAKSAILKFGRRQAELTAADMVWTQRKTPAELLSVGDLAYVKVLSLGADGTARISLEQDSGVQGALLAIDNSTGDILAMVGGRNFEESKFNRATQAQRQVGSSFKPYVFATAVDNGATPDDVIYDGPTTFSTASGPYTPHNFDGKFEGNITLRRALAQSRNIPALKLAERVGIRKVIEYAHRFGITSNIPPYLPIALGSADMTLLEHTSAYSTFPNDGIRVAPRFIRKVVDNNGRVLEENYPEVHDVIPPQTARTMVSMLREVVDHGTGFAASRLQHPLGGKTGTTNDFTDAWFMGFSPSVTCGVWLGFDEKVRSLGNKETGATAALPIWIDFMKVAIQGKDKEEFPAAPPTTPTAPQPKVDKPDVAPGDGEEH